MGFFTRDAETVVGAQMVDDQHGWQQGRLAPAVDLYWIPLGAGGYVVRWSGKLYEALKALVEHRPRLDLYHSALQIWLPDDRFVIECAAILNLRGENAGSWPGGRSG
jgi:hypothetical protein